MYKDIKEWVGETHCIFLTLKGLNLRDLKRMGRYAGLDIDNYKTKAMIAKGLMIIMNSSGMPNASKDWK